MSQNITGLCHKICIDYCHSMHKVCIDYCDSFCRKTTFKKTYSHIIFSINGPQLWPLDDRVEINPPMMRMVIGHPKNMFNKVNGEPRNPYVLPRKLSIVTCHKCGAMGHNKRSCKGKRVADRVIPKGGNTKKEKGANASKVGNNKKVNST